MFIPRSTASSRIFRHAAGSLPPLGAMPIKSVLAIAGVGEAGHHGNVAAHAEQLLRRAAGLRRIEQRDDFIGLVTHDAGGGLGRDRVSVAVGENNDAAVRHWFWETPS